MVLVLGWWLCAGPRLTLQPVLRVRAKMTLILGVAQLSGPARVRVRGPGPRGGWGRSRPRSAPGRLHGGKMDPRGRVGPAPGRRFPRLPVVDGALVRWEEGRDPFDLSLHGLLFVALRDRGHRLVVTTRSSSAQARGRGDPWSRTLSSIRSSSVALRPCMSLMRLSSLSTVASAAFAPCDHL